MRIPKSLIHGFCIFLVFPLLSGCWDRIEIEDRAIVLGISVDIASPIAGEEEEEIAHTRGELPIPDQDMIQVAIQIALPGRIPLGPGEGGGGGGGMSTRETVWVLSLAGHTIADALSNLQQEVSAKLFFGHLRIVVVSEEVARRGVENINLFLRRNAEVRTTSWMVVSTLMKAAPALERVPTLYLLSTLEEGVKMGKLPIDFLAAFWARSTKKGQEGILPYIDKEKGENVNIAGLAIFKNERMVDVVKPIEAVGFMGIRGENPAGYHVIVPVPDTDGTVTVHSIKRRSKITGTIKNGLPSITINAEVDWQLDENSNKSVVINQEKLKKIEKELEKTLKKTNEELIKKTQGLESDIFGFGEYIRGKEPKYWAQHVGTKEKWQELYKKIRIDYQVKSKIRRVGMTTW